MTQLQCSWAFMERTQYPTTEARYIYVHGYDIHETEEMQPASASIKGWV